MAIRFDHQRVENGYRATIDGIDERGRSGWFDGHGRSIADAFEDAWKTVRNVARRRRRGAPSHRVIIARRLTCARWPAEPNTAA